MQIDDGKLRWHCRRGLLELDLLLSRFLASHYPSLSEEERTVFAGLVELDDPELWQRISQAMPADDTAEARLLSTLKNMRRS